jgi:hypothetical protein
MRSSLSMLEATLDILDASDVVTRVVATTDQGRDGTGCGPLWRIVTESVTRTETRIAHESTALHGGSRAQEFASEITGSTR